MRKWTANIGGWLLGLIMSFYVVTPWVAERLHQRLPVYEVDQSSVSVVCTPRTIVFSAKARKLRDFEVLQVGEIGRIRISWTFEGIEQTNTIPLLRPDGEFVPTGPQFVAGDEFVVGPFVVPRRNGGMLESVSVILPGHRWGFHRTLGIIGPIFLSAQQCPLGLMRRGEFPGFKAPSVPPEVRLAREKLRDRDTGPDVFVDALAEFGGFSGMLPYRREDNLPN